MHKNKHYRISSLAKQDLLGIFDFSIQNWGEDQARLYAQKLSSGFTMLSNSPNVGKTRNDLYEKALSFTIGSHIIFYSKNEKLGSNIEVARVLHKSMDFAKHFD